MYKNIFCKLFNATKARKQKQKAVHAKTRKNFVLLGMVKYALFFKCNFQGLLSAARRKFDLEFFPGI